jgi:hypothetical protein
MSSGAAGQWLARQYGGPVEERETSPATSATAVSVCNNDPEAVQILFVNTGANTVNLGLTVAMAIAGGIILAANGGSVSMSVSEDGTLPSREWFARSAAGASSLYILRIRRYALTETGGGNA